jgi:hypothetical protein
MMRELVMSLVEPVDNALEVHTECSTYSSEAHSFQAHLHSLCFQYRIVTHRSTVRSEISLACFTSHSFATGVIGTCFHYSF